jgi:hypothetical protein
MSLQCILVATYHTAVILWAFIFVSSGTYPSSSNGLLGQFANVTAMHSGSHLPRNSDPLGIRHFYDCVLWYWPAKQQWSCGHSLLSSQCIRDPSNIDAPRLITSKAAHRLFNCNILTPACVTNCGYNILNFKAYLNNLYFQKLCRHLWEGFQ